MRILWVIKGLVWFKKNGHSSLSFHYPSLSFHHSSLITHHLKHPTPFGTITHLSSLNIFQLFVAPYLYLVQLLPSFFFFLLSRVWSSILPSSFFFFSLVWSSILPLFFFLGFSEFGFYFYYYFFLIGFGEYWGLKEKKKRVKVT